jgi:hypothetical protein
LRAHVDPGVPWYPELPPAATRVQALEDFDQSRVMARLRLTYEDGPENWVISPRIQQLYMQQELLRKQEQAAAEAKADGEAKSDGEAKRDAAPEAASEVPDESEPPPEQPIDEKLLNKVREIEEAMTKAWSLARCDSRLTRRLGLL